MIPLIVLLSVVQFSCSFQDRNFGHERVVDNLLQNYGESQRLVRPSVNTTTYLGLSLINIRNFNDKTGILTASYWLREKWSDERLAWEDKSVESVSFPITKLWRPDFRVFNALGNKESVDLDIYPLVYQSGDVLWIPMAEYTTRCDQPEGESDEWTCNLKIGSWVHNGFELVLDLYENKTTMGIDYYKVDRNGWNVNPLESGVDNKYYKCCPNVPYASIDFRFKLSKVVGGVADNAARTRLSMLSLTALMAVIKLIF